jgi:hypothetical protein
VACKRRAEIADRQPAVGRPRQPAVPAASRRRHSGAESNTALPSRGLGSLSRTAVGKSGHVERHACELAPEVGEDTSPRRFPRLRSAHPAAGVLHRARASAARRCAVRLSRSTVTCSMLISSLTKRAQSVGWPRAGRTTARREAWGETEACDLTSSVRRPSSPPSAANSAPPAEMRLSHARSAKYDRRRSVPSLDAAESLSCRTNQGWRVIGSQRQQRDHADGRAAPAQQQRRGLCSGSASAVLSLWRCRHRQRARRLPAEVHSAQRAKEARRAALAECAGRRARMSCSGHTATRAARSAGTGAVSLARRRPYLSGLGGPPSYLSGTGPALGLAARFRTVQQQRPQRASPSAVADSFSPRASERPWQNFCIFRSSASGAAM